MGAPAAPRSSWTLKTPDQTHGTTQATYTLTFTSKAKGQVWTSGVVNSTDNNLVPFGGSPLGSDQDFEVLLDATTSDGCKATSTLSFRTGLQERADWHGKWIAGAKSAQNTTNNQLRKEFKLSADAVTRASLFISGIGYYELLCNGQNIDPSRALDVGWTDYAKRVYYSTFDVASCLVEGDNVLAVTLGNSWFSCGNPGAPTTQPGCIDAPPQLLVQLNIEQGGQATEVVSDETWATAAGPVTYDSLYNGEHYDARLETTGWELAGFDASSWTAAVLANSTSNDVPISSQLFEPIRRVAERPPVSQWEPYPGTYVLDFGQNMPAVVRIKIPPMQAGSNVTIRHAEVLMHPPYGDRDGTVYTGNLRGAQATDIYIVKGDPDGETYTPRFTQHGFRYVQITGLPFAPEVGDVLQLEMHTAVAPRGQLTFSEELLNKIQHNAFWGQKSNLMSVPTDCPQRDERRGWMGDAALTAEEALYNFGMGAMYTNWLNIIEDDQNADGSVDNFVPNVGSTDPGAPNWQSAYPSVIWGMWHYNGDVDVVKAHWKSLEAYQAYFDAEYKKDGFKNFMGGFGDWVPPPPAPKTDAHFTSGFAYMHDLALIAEMAGAIGLSDKQLELTSRLKDLGSAFNAVWFNATAGYYNTGLQTEQALPLWLGIVPEDNLQGVLDYLVDDIMTTNKGHTTCGIIGIKFLMEALSKYGLGDVGVAMSLATDYPSYGYMITNPDEPATTLWELWDSNKEGPGMNSRNHIMFGTVSSWFWKYVAGVQPAEPGYKTVAVAPDPSIVFPKITGGPTVADASLDTPAGVVSTRWVRGNVNQSAVDMEIEVPVGGHAALALPLRAATDAADITVSSRGCVFWKAGAFVKGCSGVTAASHTKDARSLDVTLASGIYAISASL